MKQKNVHIISHTHWDREWYIGATYVNEWLPAFFESLFSMLEKEPEYATPSSSYRNIISSAAG